MPELRWLQGTSPRFTLDLSAFRVDLDKPVLVDKFFCSPALDDPRLYIGDQLVAAGKCVLADPEDVGASDEDEHTWFEMMFFANRPQLPLHLLAYTSVDLQRNGTGNWPIMAYMTGAVIEPEANPSSCFVPVQRLDGTWNVILFRFGRAGLRAAEWLQDPKQLENCVPGFKLSQDLAIA